VTTIDNDGDGEVDEGCASAPAQLPGAPTRLRRQVSGSTVNLSWMAPISGAALTGYVVEVGVSPGATSYSVPLSPQTTLSAPNVGPGRYYVRVRAANDSGLRPASNEVLVRVRRF
jgi:hypothetical protein